MLLQDKHKSMDDERFVNLVRIHMVFRYGFTGFLAGLLLAIILSQWVWLEMRVSLGLIVPVGIVIGAVTGAFARSSNGLWGLLVPETAVAGLLVFLYRGDLAALTVIPAALLREGIFWPQLSLRAVNIVLVFLLAAGNLVWFLGHSGGKSK